MIRRYDFDGFRIDTAAFVELAEALVDTIAHADWVLFQKNGTDATTVAVMTCGANQDPGGPASGVYTKARDAQSLQAALAHVVGTATTVVCPGNIQSPVLCPTGVSKTFGEVRR